MSIVQANLAEQQRERLHLHMSLRNIALEQYTVGAIIATFLELLCAPRSALANPSLSPASPKRTFHVQAYGEVGGWPGDGAMDEDYGQAGFLHEYEDIFWAFDETADVWAARHFKGRRITTGSKNGTKR